MSKRTFFHIALSFLLIIAAGSSNAETSTSIISGQEAVVQEQGDSLGIELRFDKSGNLLSLKSTVYHPTMFADRRGVNKAFIIAEEKAKANIARFMNEVSSSTRIVNEVDEGLSQSTSSRGQPGESWSTQSTRNVVESLKEISTSSATALLRGVRVIEKTHNPKSDEVIVTVGINGESIAGATQLGRGMANPSGDANAPIGSKSSSDNAGNNAFPSVGYERRRSKDYDKF